jgi:hypothetical protein
VVLREILDAYPQLAEATGLPDELGRALRARWGTEDRVPEVVSMASRRNRPGIPWGQLLRSTDSGQAEV